MKAILDEMKRYLLAKGVTIEQIAEDFTKSRQTINRWFNGKATIRQAEEIRKFYKIKLKFKVGKGKYTDPDGRAPKGKK